jgi:regulatory protein
MATDPTLDPKALKKALSALQQRDRFEAEIRILLQKAHFEEHSVEKVVWYLKERRYINDRRTIINEIERRSERRAIGREKLRTELLARGASETELDELLSSGSDERELDAALSLLKSKYKPTDDRRKGGRFLYGRGYSEDTIEQAIDRFFGSDEPNDD